MDISSDLLCLFSAEATDDGDDYVLEVPRREIETGTITPGETYRVALIEGKTDGPDQPQPPVEPGEVRYVEIGDLGKQGDGIARVERGYVIIVPGTTVDERVKIEVTEVKPNFAVGEVIDPDV